MRHGFLYKMCSNLPEMMVHPTLKSVSAGMRSAACCPASHGQNRACFSNRIYNCRHPLKLAASDDDPDEVVPDVAFRRIENQVRRSSADLLAFSI